MAYTNEDRGFSLVIGANLNGEYTYLYLDTCHEKRVEGSSTIPTHPLQNGNTMADHMYRNPDTFTVSGSFSMFGRYANDETYESIGIESDRGRLAKIQSVFEYIKDNGILCNLTTMRNLTPESETRFKVRNNFALEHISWIENQASMSFTLSFKEIITVAIEEYELKDDADLPNIVMPPARTLGQMMVAEENEDEVSPYVKIVILALQENGYLQNGVARALQLMGTVLLGYVAAKTIIFAAILLIAGIIKAGVAIGAAIAAAVGASAAITPAVPVGTIIGIAAIAIIGVGITIMKVVNNVKEKRRQKKMFKLVNNLQAYVTKDGTVDEKALQEAINIKGVSINESEVDRLNRFLTEVKNSILAVQSDCMFYAISNGKDDNTEREVVLNIANKAYYLSFINDSTNTDYGWKLQVSTTNSTGESVVLDGTNGISLNSSWCPCTSFEDMDLMTNCIFKDATREYQVYLYAPNLEINQKEDEQEVVKKLLCSYYIVVSKGNVQSNVEKIYKAIDDAIRAGGYE